MIHQKLARVFAAAVLDVAVALLKGRHPSVGKHNKVAP